MATNPTGPQRWPKNARWALNKTIETACDGVKLLDDARSKLDRREHPALTALDIADAMRCFDRIVAMMKDADRGIEKAE